MNVKINKNLCVGLFCIGFLSHYSNKEIEKYPEAQYIAKVLKKKHFDLKNGTPKDRLVARGGRYSNKMIIDARVKNETALRLFQLHGQLADKAWRGSCEAFPSDNGITVIESIIALLRKSPSTMKFYKFNQKKLDKIQLKNRDEDTYIFSSSRVASKLLERLDIEISYLKNNHEEII